MHDSVIIEELHQIQENPSVIRLLELIVDFRIIKLYNFSQETDQSESIEAERMNYPIREVKRTIYKVFLHILINFIWVIIVFVLF